MIIMAKDEIKKLFKKNKLIIGTQKTIKALRLVKLDKVFLSSNCPEEVEKNIAYYSKLAKVNIVKLNMPNDELGVLCKKQFPISVLGMLK